VIPLLLMLAAADAPAMTPVDAERAFAADAQKIGQWTAFRKWSTDDATMFAPQPVNVHSFLFDKKDPAKAIDWWPTASYLSCDGKTAVNTGGWKQPDGSAGYFTTIWQRQSDGGWRWVLDSGDTVSRALERPAKPVIRKATCPGPQWSPTAHTHGGPPGGPTIWEVDGHSGDESLSWHWIKWSNGPLELKVSMTRAGKSTKSGLVGGAREQVIFDRVIPPK
jgi:hypothetical protein